MKTTASQFSKNIISTKYLHYFYGFSNTPESLPINIQNAQAIYQDILNGTHINATENKPITHHQCRQATESLTKIKTFCNTIHNKKTFKSICHIGIGGSISGIKWISHALTTWEYPQHLPTVFISSHDEHHIKQTLKHVDIDTTLFIIASKSGTTIEIKKIISTLSQTRNKAHFLKNQCITITTKNSPLDRDEYLDVFTFDTGIGGRFSSTSAIALVTLGLSYGTSLLNEFLGGARHADEDAKKDIDANISLRQAIIRFEQQQQFNGLALVPYGEALHHLPTFMTQLICESLGKSANNNHEFSTHPHAPIVMQGIGPDAQHTFFQQLHQGVDIIPSEFIFTAPKTDNQIHILKQIIGQMVSLYEGQPHELPHHHFSGNRPSTLTLLKTPTIATLGYFIATIENRIMFEGILHNINAFDQPGVELGKTITKSIETPGSLAHQIYENIQSNITLNETNAQKTS